MKAFIIILSSYLIALSCLPCADGEIVTLGKDNVVLHTEKEHNHSDENHVDLCSPFCACSCCGAQIFSVSQIQIFDFPPQIQLIVMQQPAYQSSLTAFFSGSIWQPPQIV